MPALTRRDVKARVTYHAPTQDGVARHESLSNCIEDAMHTVLEICPIGREQSLAMTKLEEAKFWASAAVARDPVTR